MGPHMYPWARGSTHLRLQRAYALRDGRVGREVGPREERHVGRVQHACAPWVQMGWATTGAALTGAPHTHPRTPWTRVRRPSETQCPARRSPAPCIKQQMKDLRLHAQRDTRGPTCASTVLAPRCGVQTTCGWAMRPAISGGGGSCRHTRRGVSEGASRQRDAGRGMRAGTCQRGERACENTSNAAADTCSGEGGEPGWTSQLMRNKQTERALALPVLRASSRSASLTMPPRATLMMRTPVLHLHAQAAAQPWSV